MTLTFGTNSAKIMWLSFMQAILMLANDLKASFGWREQNREMETMKEGWIAEYVTRVGVR